MTSSPLQEERAAFLLRNQQLVYPYDRDSLHLTQSAFAQKGQRDVLIPAASGLGRRRKQSHEKVDDIQIQCHARINRVVCRLCSVLSYCPVVADVKTKYSCYAEIPPGGKFLTYENHDELNDDDSQKSQKQDVSKSLEKIREDRRSNHHKDGKSAGNKKRVHDVIGICVDQCNENAEYDSYREHYQVVPDKTHERIIVRKGEMDSEECTDKISDKHHVEIPAHKYICEKRAHECVDYKSPQQYTADQQIVCPSRHCIATGPIVTYIISHFFSPPWHLRNKGRFLRPS